MKVLSFLALSVAFAWASENAGVEAGITETGIINLKNVGLPYIVNQIGEIHLENDGISAGSGLLKITANLTNLVISEFTMDAKDTVVVLEPSDIIGLYIQGLGGELTFDWDYKYFLTEQRGTGFADIKDCDITTTLYLRIVNSRPNIQIGHTKVYIKTFEIKLTGNLIADAADAILNLLNGRIKKKIESTISDTITSSIQQALNNAFEQMDENIAIPSTDFSVNYTFTGDLAITNEYIVGMMKGLITYTKDPDVDPPIDPPVALPSLLADKQDFQFYVTQYTIDSLLYSLYQEQFTFNISSGMVPENPYFNLDTTSLNAIFPNLTTAYGKDKPCDMLCKLEDPPDLELLSNEDSTLNFPSECGLVVRGEGQAALIDITGKTKVKFSLDDWVINSDIDFVTVDDITVTDRVNIGEVNTNGLRILLNLVFKTFVPEVDKKYLNPGIPLPQFAIANFTDSKVTVFPGYLFIEATPEWNFQELISY